MQNQNRGSVFTKNNVENSLRVIEGQLREIRKHSSIVESIIVMEPTFAYKRNVYTFMNPSAASMDKLENN